MRSYPFALIVLTLFGPAGTAAAQAPPHVEIASFQVAAKDPKSEFGRSLTRGFSGVDLAVYFAVPGEAVLSFDSDKSKVALAADGVDLPLSIQIGGDSMFGFNLNEDPSSGIVQMASEKIPAKTSTKLSLKGEFVLFVGNAAKTEESEFKVVEDGKVKLGLVEATLRASQDRGNPNMQMVQFSAAKPFDSVSKLEFIDTEGKVVESFSAGDGSYTRNDVKFYQRSYGVSSAAKTLKVRVTYFSQVETITLPVDLEFGLGL